MKFSYFSSPKAQKGQECTYELYLKVANDPDLLELCHNIAAETDKEKRSEMKKKLPVITWQAYFAGKRIASEAEPSGLFMLDIDHVDDPFALYSKQIASRVKELGIVYVGKTASTHGLRIVAKCLPMLHTLEECQKWLASNLKVDYDGVCKDFARCSFLVHDSYTYYMDAKAIWKEEAAEGTRYAAGKNPIQTNAAMEDMLNSPATSRGGQLEETSTKGIENPHEKNANDGGAVDQREGLFGGSSEYKGVPYVEICKEWLEYTGGEPTEGQRNARLYKLALRLRYITDFNEVTMLRVMPRYGLTENEMRQLIHSATGASRGAEVQKDMKEVLERIDRRKKLGDDVDDGEIPEVITDTHKVPALPPVFKQWYEIAPEDFKTPVILCQLPILGALGSRLRAKYLDGKLNSPSFQVSLEAPQASGKSFMGKLVDYELAQMKESDEEQRQLERDYQEKVSEMKLLNIKINADNKDEILGSKPKGIIRYVPATISITKMLMRMEGAKGLHLFAMSPEIDTVYKAFKRQISSLSDALRVSFDNDEYGQDYASDMSWSGNIRLYYNCLYSGTPKAMCRFYPDVEDGLVSRVCFVTLPDQFGKPMPVWGEFDAEQKRICDIGLTRLNEISIQGSEVQPEHLMKMEWLNKALKSWLVQQQQEAVKEDDRTRDIFCRRAAVVGFRAGMLAWFLWEEKNTPTIRRNVMNFSIWVANNMLNQHLLRFNVNKVHSNVNQWGEIFEKMPEEFTREELERALRDSDVNTSVKMVLYKWRLLGVVEPVDVQRKGNRNKLTTSKFKKVKK